MVYRNPYDGYSEEGGGYSCQEEYAGCREPDSQYYTHQAQVRKSKMDWNCCLLGEISSDLDRSSLCDIEKLSLK